MRTKIFLVLTITYMFGCGVLTEEGKNLLSFEDDGIETELISFKDSDPNCNSNCTGVEISYELAENNVRLNQAIEKSIVTQLQYFVEDGDRLSNKEDLVNGFISDYQDFKKDFPESQTPWTIEILGDVTYASERVISYKLTLLSYTGGAHSNEEVLFFNYDNNGQELPLSTLIDNRSKLMEEAELAFRKKTGLSAQEDLGAAGYSFEDNEFQLPENIGFSKRGMILYYNDYEIASHADGATEVLLSFERLSEAVKF